MNCLFLNQLISTINSQKFHIMKFITSTFYIHYPLYYSCNTLIFHAIHWFFMQHIDLSCKLPTFIQKSNNFNYLKVLGIRLLWFIDPLLKSIYFFKIFMNMPVSYFYPWITYWLFFYWTIISDKFNLWNNVPSWKLSNLITKGLKFSFLPIVIWVIHDTQTNLVYLIH